MLPTSDPDSVAAYLAELHRQTSMIYWWPKVQHIDVPKPKTRIIPFEPRELIEFIDPDAARTRKAVLAVVTREAAGFDYPLFLRTDLASGKHSWKDACFVAGPELLPRCLYNVLEANALADLFPAAVVLREYVPLESAFTAFWGDMPVTRERRYFVRDGKVVCHHPCWPEEAMSFMPGKEPDGWREKLRGLNQETDAEVNLLTDYARKLGAVLDGYWSLDFAKGQNGVWYFIDAARGELSWHPDCPANVHNSTPT